MTTHTERNAVAAESEVASWQSLTPAERTALMRDANYRGFASGGGMASVNGVDRWFPSWRHALAELVLHRFRRP